MRIGRLESLGIWLDVYMAGLSNTVIALLKPKR